MDVWTIVACALIFDAFIFLFHSSKKIDRSEEILTLKILIARNFVRLLSRPLLGAWLLFCISNRQLEWNLPVWMEVLIVFIVVEFVHWLRHYLDHYTDIGWAIHRVHHSLTTMNIRSGLRNSPFVDFGFQWPIEGALMVLGVDPILFFTLKMLQTVYTGLIHFEFFAAKENRRWMDLIFQTPSNHRVHHGIQDFYRGKNLGGFTTFFDHMFGTFQMENLSAPPIYGPYSENIHKSSSSFSFKAIVFGGFKELLSTRQVKKSPNL